VNIGPLTYDAAIAWWYGRINYEVRAAQPGDLKLERMQALLARLGNPHERLPIVHITGTKGKGSTAAMLAAVFRAAGLHVGLFTSPHLTQVEERIQVDGEPISRTELAELMTEVAAAAPEPDLTFFEIGTALGFLHFERRHCDVAMVEVGLGGRFDSTNVCTPLVSVITNVGFDHMAQLGSTLEAIAYEKAGIVKSGVPVVMGAIPEAPAAVIRRVAAQLDAPLRETRAADLDSSLRIGLVGEHQRENAACAVAAIECLRGSALSVPESAIRKGLADVRWPARIEVVGREPLVILDSAHNVPSVIALVRTLRESFPVRGRKNVVFAVSSDKQHEEMLRILAGYFDAFHLTQYGNNPRCVDPRALADSLNRIAPHVAVTVHPTSADAWQSARDWAGPGDLFCITGSMFLAGELQPLIAQ